MMENNCWIKIHYKFLEWEWFQEDGMVRLFIDLLLKANYQSKKWKGIAIERGQLVTSRNQLSVETGLSEKKIRTCLSRLENTGEISINSTNKCSIITISNYEIYQINRIVTGQQKECENTSLSICYDEDEGIGASKGPAKGQQRANKNQKNGQQKECENTSLSICYDEDEDITGQQRANKNLEKIQKGATTKEYNNIYNNKETSTKVEEKKVKLSFANSKNTTEIRSRKFYDSLIPYVAPYGREMIRNFYDYWSEPNKSHTKMRFELERTWDLKRRLGTWSRREKINISNGTSNKQYQQQQRAREIEELNQKLNESGF